MSSLYTCHPACQRDDWKIIMSVPDAVRACVFLLRATEAPAPAVYAFVTAHGPVEAVERIRAGAAPVPVLDEITHATPDLDADLEVIDSGAARLVTPEDNEWPHERLDALSGHGLGAPLGLWVHGSASLSEITQTTVSVVGTRAASGYGEHVAAEIAGDLARRGVTIVSSGSYGIDGRANGAALTGTGRSVAVLACGVDITYPAGHAGLLEAIVEHGGVLVSEYPPGTTPRRQRFLARLRLIAALGAATVVVEAGVRSSVLTVATTAHQLGRRVYGVPGPVTSAASAGVLDLLRSGVATPVGSAAHILDRDGIH
jgi:DNA processing protein